MTTIVKSIIGLELDKFYIFKIAKQESMNSIARLRRDLFNNGIRGLITDCDIEIIIPKKEEVQNEN